MQYKQTKKSLPEIARELGVDGIVEGTVQRSGDRVRVTAQLIHAASDKHLWASSYERNMSEFFALERAVAEDVAHQIQATLTTRSSLSASQYRPTNPTALEAYLQGNYHLNKYGRGSGEQEKKTAAEYFQQAIDADPNFAAAYIGMAHAHNDLPQSSREDWTIIRTAAGKALELDPNSSEARTLLAGFKWRDSGWQEAEKEYRGIVVLDPNSAEAHEQFCEFLGEIGRLDEAWTECQIAQELDPNNDHLAAILYFRGEYDRAIAVLRMTIERHPDDGGLHYLLFENYAKNGNYKESIEELEKTLTLYGFPEAGNRIQHAFAISGYRAAMRQWAEGIEHVQASEQFFAPVNLADAYATLGEKDRAFYWLEQAYLHADMISSGEGATMIKVDPMLASLRSDPRFEDIVRRIGLPP